MRAACATLASIGLCIACSAQALQIEFDYSYDTRGFFTDTATGAPLTERRALLTLAASFYSGFTDALAPIAPQAGDSWSVRITHPSLGGPQITLTNLTIPADTLRIYVGGSDSAPGVLGFANTGSRLSATGSTQFVQAVTTRGQSSAIGPNATDYGVWGGMIWFNAANDWYFGAGSGGLQPGRPDFLTTATHEIGHILGYGEADSWGAQIDERGHFIGAASVAAHGGPVPLDRFRAHWAEGTMSTYGGMLQETMMDPSTPAGERQLPTILDYAGFADIGWQVSVVPEPAIALLLGPGALLALGVARRRRRTSAS